MPLGGGPCSCVKASAQPGRLPCLLQRQVRRAWSRATAYSPLCWLLTNGGHVWRLWLPLQRIEVERREGRAASDKGGTRVHSPSSCHTGPGSYARHGSCACLVPLCPCAPCCFPGVPVVYDLLDVDGEGLGIGGACHRRCNEDW